MRTKVISSKVTDGEFELFKIFAVRQYHDKMLNRSTVSSLIQKALYWYIQRMGYDMQVVKEFLDTRDTRIFGYLPNEDIVLAV